MSKADKMFEELGYFKAKGITNDEIAWFQWQDRKEYLDYKTRNILFYKDKTWNITSGFIGDTLFMQRPTLKEHLAIHEKIKELGWLDD